MYACRLLFLFILTNTVCIACLNDTGVLDRALCCWWYEWDFFHNLGLLHCANQIIECFFQCDLTYECFSVNQAIIVWFLSWWTLDLYVSLVSMIDTGMRRHHNVLYVTEISWAYVFQIWRNKMLGEKYYDYPWATFLSYREELSHHF